MGDIDYFALSMITALNTVVAIIVKETIDWLKEKRRRIQEELSKRIKNNKEAMKEG